MNKTKFYDRYITTHYGGNDFLGDKSFRIYIKYFKRNYLCHLPSDKGTRIVDLACGVGHFLTFLQVAGYQNIEGIDLSPENVEFCLKKELTAQKGDIFDFLRTNKKPISVIILNDIIEHLKKEEAMELLKLAKEALADGGKVIIKAPNLSNPITGPSSLFIDFTHEVGYTENNLRQLLNVIEFREVTIYPLDIYVFTGNPINYIAKLAAWVFNHIFRILFILYGRKSVRIFTKDILAVAQK